MTSSLSFYNIDVFCSQVKLDEPKPVIDLSTIEFITPFALTYLGLFIRWQNQKGRGFNIILPQKQETKNYLNRQNFFERFNIRVIDEALLLDFDPYKYSFEMVDISKDYGLSDSIAKKISDVIHYKDIGVPVEEFCEISAELVDNFVIHSEENRGVMVLQYFPKKRSLCMAIGDCGIGIRASLSKNPKFAYLINRSHDEAIRKAIELGASRLEEERGYGFYEVIEKISECKGEFSLVSFGGYLRITNGIRKTGHMKFELPGVQIEFSLPENVR